MHPKKSMNGWTEEQYIKAENTKKSKKKAKRDVAEKASMASQIKNLQEKNILLENRIRELECQYQNNLKAMHDNFKQILNHIQITHLNEIKKITDDFRLFPKKYIDEKPMFGIMMDYAEKKITSPAFLTFCFMIHIMHNSTYKVLNDFLPMVPDSTCRQLLSPSRNLIKGCLLNIQGIHRILSKSFTSQVPITLAGDAASIKPYGEKGLNSVYTYMALSLFKHIKPTVVHICPTKCGSSSDEIVSKFDTIAKVIEDFGLQVKFIATDGDGAFDKLHENWFKKVNEVLSKNLTFEEKIKILKKYNKMPISDPFHLAKNGRAHLINHPVMLDNQTMKCINMMLFTDAVKLGPILFDKSSIAAMKDNYMLNLFSWNSFVKLLAAQRFDGAMYVFPFMLLLNAIRSKNLNKKDRFNFLSIAIKHFYFYLRQVNKSDPKDFFTPTFHNASSIGTLFGDRIFIIRCINTCVAIAVALDIGADYDFFLALSRLGTHDVECHYGKVRVLSSFNHSFDNVVSVTANAMLLNNFCNSLNYKFKIRTRENEGGAVITDAIWNLPCINVDFNYISDTLYFLFESIKLSDTQIRTFEYLVNSYSEIVDMRQCPIFKVDKMFCGSLPFYRYMTNFYVQSLLPIPSCLNVTSPLDFFIKDPKMSKRIQKIQTQQWFSRLVCLIANIKSIGGEIQAIPFPCVHPLQTNADIYNQVSFWMKTMLNKLPGEVISIDNIELQQKETENVKSILRLDDSFNKYLSDDLPVRADGSIIQLHIGNPITESYESIEQTCEVRKKDNINQDKRNQIFMQIDECVRQFMTNRSSLLKKETKAYVLSRIYRDIECILKLVDSFQKDFLANQLSEINLSKVAKGPDYVSKKADDVNDMIGENDDLIGIDQLTTQIDEIDEKVD